MPAIAKVAGKVAKGAKPDAPEVDATPFDDLHPRAVKGTPNAGEFVALLERVKALGGNYDAKTEKWSFPKGSGPALKALLEEIGGNVVEAPEGMRVASDADRKKLKIPPAWTDVFVHNEIDSFQNPTAEAPLEVMRLLATGRDKQGRGQYRYSEAHSADQAAKKFARIRSMSDHMPAFDAEFERGVANGDDTAAAAMMIRTLGLRPGSTSDTKAKAKAYGATTLLRQHVKVQGSTVKLDFIGKKGVHIQLEVDDPALARMLKPRMKGPADAPLFATSERKVNALISKVAPDHTAKDFRTAKGTAVAVHAVKQMPKPQNAKDLARMKNQIGDIVSAVLGNDRKEALKSYIDPSVFGPWEDSIV